MALCFERGVAEMWQVLRKSSACWLCCCCVCVGPWALLGLRGTYLVLMVQQSVIGSYVSISLGRSDLQALADHPDMGKTLSVCPCKHVPPRQQILARLRVVQASDTISETSSLVGKTCWVKDKEKGSHAASWRASAGEIFCTRLNLGKP